MTEKEIERESVEWVFALTGGELEDKPWRFASVDKNGELERHWAWYWYEGQPEYLKQDYSHTYRTAVLWWEPPKKIRSHGREWRLVGLYRSSGETECPARGCDEGVEVLEKQCDGGNVCPLCEEDVGETHGYIYLGDGWCEAVYRTKG